MITQRKALYPRLRFTHSPPINGKLLLLCLHLLYVSDESDPLAFVNGAVHCVARKKTKKEGIY